MTKTRTVLRDKHTADEADRPMRLAMLSPRTALQGMHLPGRHRRALAAYASTAMDICSI
jgi:hypothetical protein